MQLQELAAIEAALHHGKAGPRSLTRVDGGSPRQLLGDVVDETGKVAFACRRAGWMPALVVGSA